MKLYLICRAKDRKKVRGSESDRPFEPDLRPLSVLGYEQARAIGVELGRERIARIVCGPELAAQQTVEPLALATGVEPEVDERLASGTRVQRALELFPDPSPARDAGATVLCANAELIVSLLRFFELDDAESPGLDGLPPCKKGSYWTLEGPGASPTAARYAEPTRGLAFRAQVPVVEPPASVRAAVLDLGSTSFTMLIADVSADGRIQPVVRETCMLRLGAVIAADGEIPKPVRERTVQVAGELLEVARQEKVQRILPVATAALRDARNGRQVASRISKELGTPVRILSGEEEAHTIFRGICGRVNIGSATALGMDLGGGSLELAVGTRDRVDAEVTLRLGVTRLHNEWVTADPMRPGDARRIRKQVRKHLAPHVEALLANDPSVAIATGGTSRGLARLRVEGRTRRGGESIWPYDLSTDALGELAEQLISSSHDERLAMRGMRERRADLLPTGALILHTLAEQLGLERLIVSDWGLREGVLLEAIADS